MRAARLPDCLLSGITPKVIAAWRARAAVEAPSHLRSHPRPLMLTLLAALVHERQREITDTLADLLIPTVHRIDARAERKVTQELVSEFRKVAGKGNAAVPARRGRDRPARRHCARRGLPGGGREDAAGPGRRVQASGPAYRRTVQTTLRASYTGHYRRGLIKLLDALE